MIMSMPRMSNRIMLMIFTLLALWTVINAEFSSYDKTNDYNTSEISGRLRRAPFHRYIPPNILTATIKDGDKEIRLTWQRVERYLVNKYLPVYTLHINSWGPTHKKSDVMKIVGNFVMYHDAEHKSAVIYFENLDRIEGVVGKSYQIIDLSIDQLSQPLQVDGRYVRRLSHPPHGRTKVSEVETQLLGENNVLKRQIDEEWYNISSLRVRRDAEPEPSYIETLVLVTHDMYQKIRNKSPVGVLNSLIISYLLHFNALDMIFSNLPKDLFLIYMNLAGIIIEVEDGALSQITKYPSLTYGNNDILDINFLLEDFERYPDHFDFPFKRDSFDLILISTTRELEFGRRKPNGWHSDKIDVFAERQAGRLSFVPMVIIRSLGTFSSHCITAHEIGKILGIRQNDPFDKGTIINNMQCYGLMQSSQNYCNDCIKWSDESISQLKAFFRDHRYRCFLLNKPRSLHPPDTSLVSLTPCRQCTCFGYVSYGRETPDECPLYIPSDSCDLPLQCKRKIVENELQLESTILPLDGTPCGENKVCWDERCISVGKIESDPIIPTVINLNSGKK